MTFFRDFKFLKKRDFLFALCFGISLVAGATDPSLTGSQTFHDGESLNHSTVVLYDEVIIEGKLFTNGYPLSIVANKLTFNDGAQIIAFRDPATPPQAPTGANGADNNSEKPKGDKLNGDAGGTGGTGNRGTNGTDGNPNPAKIDIYVHDVVVGIFNINANGQNGGKGGQGGTGGIGGHGGRGSTARTMCPAYHQEAGNGGIGGRGGDGGQGGTGGKPGPKVDVGADLPDGVVTILTQLPGNAGSGGDRGAPGEGGPGGSGGGPDWSDCFLSPDIDQAGGHWGPKGPSGSWGAPGLAGLAQP